MHSVFKLKLVVNNLLAVLVQIFVNLAHQFNHDVMEDVGGKMIVNLPHLFVCGVIYFFEPGDVGIATWLNACYFAGLDFDFPFALDYIFTSLNFYLNLIWQGCFGTWREWVLVGLGYIDHISIKIKLDWFRLRVEVTETIALDLALDIFVAPPRIDQVLLSLVVSNCKHDIFSKNFCLLNRILFPVLLLNFLKIFDGLLQEIFQKQFCKIVSVEGYHSSTHPAQHAHRTSLGWQGCRLARVWDICLGLFDPF